MTIKSRLALFVLALIALPGSILAQDEEVPQAPDSLAIAGNAIILLLPPAGGYEINHQAVPLADLGQQFRDIYDPRPIKILLVGWGANRPRSEVATVVLLAQEQGVKVYRVEFR